MRSATPAQAPEQGCPVDVQHCEQRTLGAQTEVLANSVGPYAEAFLNVGNRAG
jgi:hypothetical protein